MNMKDEDGFEPTSESTHLSLPTRYELANGFTSTPSRLLGDLEEKHLPQTFSIATRVAHDGIRIAVTSSCSIVTISQRYCEGVKGLGTQATRPESCAGGLPIWRPICGGVAHAYRQTQAQTERLTNQLLAKTTTRPPKQPATRRKRRPRRLGEARK